MPPTAPRPCASRGRPTAAGHGPLALDVSAPPAGVGPLTFARLRAVSFTHSCVYAALLVCAFAAGGPQPETFILGLTHGLMWIGMSLACLAAARLRIVSL